MNRISFEAAEQDEHRVSLSGRDVRDAIRLLRRLTSPEAPPATAEPIIKDRGRLIARARHEFDDRRRRIGLFGNAMFGEPAWELLISLYIEGDTARQSIARVVDLVGAAPTTLLRWLDYLQAQGMVARRPHPTDRRAAFIELTEKGQQKLDLYFSGSRDCNDRF